MNSAALQRQSRFTLRIQRRGQPIAFTRWATIGGTDKTWTETAILEPLSVKSAAMLQMEGLLNVGEPVPYLLILLGNSSVREGDGCPLDDVEWEVIQVTASRDTGVRIVTYAVITRLKSA